MKMAMLPSRCAPLALTVASVAALATPLFAGPRPGQSPPSEPPRESLQDALALVQAAAPDPAPARSADALLDELEHAGAGIRTLSASVLYDRVFVLQQDRHRRYGRLWFRSEPPPPGSPAGGKPRRTFAVKFDKLFIDDVVRNDPQAWVFDGQWLVEKRETDKIFIKRQIARPDQPIDPLRLGEGPFPLPIGQKKADILARYTAELLPAEDGLLAPDGADEAELQDAAAHVEATRGTDQLRLVPRPDRAADDDFQEIRLWYTRATRLPRMARTVNRAGDISIVTLIDVKTNQPIDPSLMSIDAPRPEDGWSVQIEEGHFKDQPAAPPAPAGGRP